jgi:hypothetical protein
MRRTRRGRLFLTATTVSDGKRGFISHDFVRTVVKEIFVDIRTISLSQHRGLCKQFRDIVTILEHGIMGERGATHRVAIRETLHTIERPENWTDDSRKPRVRRTASLSPTV